MSDFGCCARQGGHDVPDPFDAALGGAVRENRRLREQVTELQAKLADAERTLVELAPAEVLVEGSWFKPADLPTILGNYMRASVESGREAKESFVREAELQAVIAAARQRYEEGANERRIYEALIAAPSDVLAARDAQVAATERHEWADWIESGMATVGVVITPAMLARALRREHRPFGVEAGPVRGTGTPNGEQ